MNFLAHLYLSGNDEGVMTGNFMADRIKGDQAYAFDPAITRGILLHRFIDTFTDNHEVVKQSKKRLYPKYHKYAPVIIDIFYDHFLAAEFERHSDELLIDFSRKCYDVLSKNIHLMPSRVQAFLPYMIRHDWLQGYAEIEGTGRALAGLASRTRFSSNMQNAVYDLVEDYDLYKKEFAGFFPDLKKYSQDFLKVNNVVF
jgi:acyl carrier protein phosphodiesterase